MFGGVWGNRLWAAVGGSLIVIAATLAALSILPSTAAATSCPTAPWKELEVAHEIIDTATVYTDPRAALRTYKGAGDNPIPDDVWNAGYAPPSPYIANTTRNLQFNESQFIASPGEPICTTAYITTSDGYTWGAMSTAINALWPYDRGDYSGLAGKNAYFAGNLVTTPPPGVVKVTANFKAQNIKFWANEDDAKPGSAGAVPLDRYFVRDQWGNEYVMHASAGTTPEEVKQNFHDAVLPPGWKKIHRHLDKDLILRPAEGSDGSFHYLVFRDSADNTYHQYRWAGEGSLEQVVDGAAMPAWGGQGDDTLRGGPRGDLIHGAGGDDRIHPRWGKDEVWGDAGNDVVVLPGRASRYRLLELSGGGKHLRLRGYGARKTLEYVERLRFERGGGRIDVDQLRQRDVGKRL